MLRPVLRLTRPIAFASATAFAAAFAAGCSEGAADPTVQPEPTEVTFPPGFAWGTGTAGFQIESGLDDTDWGIWATLPGKIANGDLPNDGPDALAHIAGDVGLMTTMGLTSYRFSIELARVYPTRADFDADTPDPAGLSAYDALIDALGDEGIEPLVTLHHFVWPSYLRDPTEPGAPQGFEREEAVDLFATWCRRMGAHFGDRVDIWVTINEPTVEASVGYLASVFPPGVSDTERMVAVMKRQVQAHARCYDALHEVDQSDADGDGAAALVSIAKHDRVYEPFDSELDTDLEAVQRAKRFWNQWFTDAIVLGDLDEDFDGVVDVAGDPALVGRADYLGLNYYGVSRVGTMSLELPHVGPVPVQIALLNERPKSDLRWDIYPAGFGVVIDDMARYGLPIYITENGLADSEDVNRSRFLAEHLFEIGKAMLRGVDIRGYYHWSLIDNFEWAGGFCPRFGFYTVDFDSPEKTRSPTAAVPLMADIADTGRLTQATIDALPGYVSAPAPCEGF
jgi:beta-glucosidase